MLTNRVSNNTGLTEQLLQLKLSGCKSPSVFHRDYKSLPLFKNYSPFEEFLQKAPNNSSSNKWSPSAAVKIFFYWWNKIYGKNSDASRRQSGYEDTFTKARHGTRNRDDSQKARGYGPHAMEREEPDYENFFRNFLQEPNEAQQESEDLAGMDDLIARILHIGENNENDE